MSFLDLSLLPDTHAGRFGRYGSPPRRLTRYSLDITRSSHEDSIRRPAAPGVQSRMSGHATPRRRCPLSHWLVLDTAACAAPQFAVQHPFHANEDGSTVIAVDNNQTIPYPAAMRSWPKQPVGTLRRQRRPRFQAKAAALFRLEPSTIPFIRSRLSRHEMNRYRQRADKF